MLGKSLDCSESEAQSTRYTIDRPRLLFFLHLPSPTSSSRIVHRQPYWRKSRPAIARRGVSHETCGRPVNWIMGARLGYHLDSVMKECFMMLLFSNGPFVPLCRPITVQTPPPPSRSMFQSPRTNRVLFRGKFDKLGIVQSFRPFGINHPDLSFIPHRRRIWYYPRKFFTTKL